jgi:hypothetical protein
MYAQYLATDPDTDVREKVGRAIAECAVKLK